MKINATRPLVLTQRASPTTTPTMTDSAARAPDTAELEPASPAIRWSNGLDWATITWLVILHLGALASPLFFTWKGILLTYVLGWVSGGLGICLGYHRLLTHGSFQTYRPIRWVFAWLGSLAGEGPPTAWVANHRKHHQFSDQESDPHSPRHGAWWSHMLWFFPRPRDRGWRDRIRRYAPDLLKDPFMRFLEKSFLGWHFASGIALFLVGWLGWNLYTGVSFMMFGLFLRLVYVMHVTWLVNSASHLWGYRNYTTRDNSRNLWWVALLAYGEGWHNNHHAFQRAARHGHRWWEIDMTWWVIWLMERCGLAWNVVRPPAR